MHNSVTITNGTHDYCCCQPTGKVTFPLFFFNSICNLYFTHFIVTSYFLCKGSSWFMWFWFPQIRTYMTDWFRHVFNSDRQKFIFIRSGSTDINTLKTAGIEGKCYSVWSLDLIRIKYKPGVVWSRFNYYYLQFLKLLWHK